MKILLIANKPPYPPKDGGTLATLNMAKSLAEQNSITVIALTSSKHKSSTDQIPTELKNRIRFLYIDIDASINFFQVIINLLFSNTPIGIQRYYSKNISQEICNHIISENYDIVQLEGLYVTKYIKEIRKNYSKKIVYRAHNIEHHIWERDSKSKLNPLIKWYYNNLSKRLKNVEIQIVNQVDAIVSISNLDNEWFRKNDFNKPSIVVPVGFFTENYQKINQNRVNNAISYIGALDWIPNQEGLIWFLDKVWPLILETNQNLTFHIAGRNAPEWLTKRLKTETGITFYGEVDDSTDFIQKFDIAVVPLFSGSGMRVKVIELMLNQVAIVSTYKGVEGLSKDINAYIMVSDSPNQYADFVIQLQNNSALTSTIKSKAYTFAVNNFDIAKKAEDLADFLKKLSNDY